MPCIGICYCINQHTPNCKLCGLHNNKINVRTKKDFYDNGTTNCDFIEPVTHKTEVSEGYIGIYTPKDLDNIRNDLTSNYILMNEINLSVFEEWIPIGLSISDPGVYESSAFKGVFDGNGYSIKNMRVSITAELEVYTNLNTCYLGLFATTNNASIINLNLEEGEIDARIENATLDENGSATGPSEGVICSGGLIVSA